MNDGFVKVAAATPKIKVADVKYNEEQIELLISEGAAKGAKVIVFPELALSGYTCGDLFEQKILIDACSEALKNLAEFTANFDSLVFVGLPFEVDGKLYNAAAVLHRGLVLAIIPKTYLPNYSEFYEKRHFTEGNAVPKVIDFYGMETPFGTNIIFENSSEPKALKVAAEICEDGWVLTPPSMAAAAAGADLIVNLSASDEVIGKDDFRRTLVSALSARQISAYVYASAGEGESSQDLVFGGHNIIAQNGAILAESKLFHNEITYADIDVERLCADRRRQNTYVCSGEEEYLKIPFSLSVEETRLSHKPERFPFVPDDAASRDRRCDEVLNIQAMGLKKRLDHVHASHAVIGISGGLDSTLALLVTVRAFDSLGLDRSGITAVTMPGFGTTDRTYTNAVTLIKTLGCEFREVSIVKAVRQHFEDIGHDENVHDVTYENSQARMRTEILMDIANQNGGLVIGTGDMSELALGWATYNGDHMSMYGVNAGVPKTLVRHLVRYYADTCGEEVLKDVLLDVLDTPVSPELLPPTKDGEIAQQTEDLVGPYELHDFFLYYVLRFGFKPSKIYRLAVFTFDGIYSAEVILKWLKTFYRRFFTQQFKRSCLPDSPKVGTIALSPRGDLRMPSDAVSRLWLEDLENL
ncbi:MAG: NAD(+) synthase [Lachnospiraceae bacterium]|nr:NAD(+) synthase [Lachnospiraceae bacterium]